MGPLARIIPTGWQVWGLRLEGQSPLLQNSAEFDRRSDTYRAFRTLGSKRGKTYEDELRLAEMEFHLGLYYDDEIGVYIPGKNVKELLRSSATKFRDGENVVRSLLIPLYRIPLLYDGPREPQDLFEAGFYDVRMVANAGAGSGRVPRCRPMFGGEGSWAVETPMAFDPQDLDPDRVQAIIQESQKRGLGDGRKIGFGAFRAETSFILTQREASKADATKLKDAIEQINLEAASRRIAPGALVTTVTARAA